MSRWVPLFLLTAAMGLAACAGPPVHEFDKRWYSTAPSAEAKDFAWAAVRCSVPEAHWEVTRDLQVQKFSSFCMRHYGFIRRDLADTGS